MNQFDTIYTQDQRQKDGFFGTWKVIFSNIIKSKDLIYQLFKRDFFATYKKSFFGLSWILVSPIIGVISWIFLNYAGVLKPGELPNHIPFTVYVLISSSLWGLFMGFYSSAASTLSTGASFIMQVKYPHEALLVKQMAQHLANFSISFVLNLLIILLFGVTPTAYIFLFPLLIIPMFCIGAALGLVVSVISVVAADITNIINLGLSMLLYITPIIYVKDKIDNPLLKSVVELNPMTYLVGGVRDLILFGYIDHPERFIALSIAAFILFLFAWRLFYISESKVIEKMI